MKDFPKGLTIDTVIEAVERDDCVGFCMTCGAECSEVEPDLVRGECSSCDAQDVYGAEEIIIRFIEGGEKDGDKFNDCD